MLKLRKTLLLQRRHPMKLGSREYMRKLVISDEEFEKYTKFCNEAHNKDYLLKRAQLFGYDKNAMIAPGACVAVPVENVGKNVLFSFHCYVNGNVTIGDNVLIGPHCSVTAGDHKFDPATKAFNTLRNNDDFDVSIVIGEGSWLAHGVSVTSGVRIGRGNLICAGAVVTKSTPDFAIMAGIPARQVGEINPDTGEYTWYSRQAKKERKEEI